MYSNNIQEWSSGETVTAGSRRGWLSSIWTASIDTTDEPSDASPAWTRDEKPFIKAISFVSVHVGKPLRKGYLNGVTFVESHINRQQFVNLSCVSFIEYRPKIDTVDAIVPTSIRQIRYHDKKLDSRQKATEERLVE